MKKGFLVLFITLFCFFTFLFDVKANTVIPVTDVEGYFNAIETIHNDSNGVYTISLDGDIVITEENKSLVKNSNTIDNGNTVTILGNGHKIKCEVSSNCRLRVSGGTLYLGKIEGNDTLSIEGGGTSKSTQESLVFVANGNAYMYDGVTLQENNSGSGAAAGSAVSLGNNGIFHMEGGVMQNNSSTTAGVGGAVDVSQPGCKFIMNGGEIKNNESSSWAGAIYQADGELILNRGKITNNQATYGGAIAVTTGTLFVGNVTFEGNEGTYGGTILAHEDTDTAAITSVTIDGATFKSNSGYYGGAIMEYGVANMVVRNSIFDSNSGQYGGGLMNYSGSLISENNAYYKNNSVSAGGAIFSQADIESKGDVIKGNTSSTGGGVYLSSGDGKFGTSRVFNNKATSAANDFFIKNSVTSLAIMDASNMNGYAIYGDQTVNTTTWYEDPSDGRYDYNNPTTSILSSAVVSGSTYKLTVSGNSARVVYVNTNGGTYLDDIVVNPGAKATRPANPTKYSSRFVNWYSDTGLTNLFDFNSAINSNTAINAKWTDLVYEVVDGANQDHSKTSTNNIFFTIDANYSLFTGGKVFIDGVYVDPSNYTSSSGSTIINLKNSYLSNLDVGAHNIRATFNDGGIAATTFNIVTTSNQSGNSGTSNDSVNPNTGDGINIYIGLMFMSMLCLYGLTKKRITN